MCIPIIFNVEAANSQNEERVSAARGAEPTPQLFLESGWSEAAARFLGCRVQLMSKPLAEAVLGPSRGVRTGRPGGHTEKKPLKKGHREPEEPRVLGSRARRRDTERRASAGAALVTSEPVEL